MKVLQLILQILFLNCSLSSFLVEIFYEIHFNFDFRSFVSQVITKSENWYIILEHKILDIGHSILYVRLG